MDDARPDFGCNACEVNEVSEHFYYFLFFISLDSSLFFNIHPLHNIFHNTVIKVILFQDD